jgi:hypothetical protein
MPAFYLHRREIELTKGRAVRRQTDAEIRKVTPVLCREFNAVDVLYLSNNAGNCEDLMPLVPFTQADLVSTRFLDLLGRLKIDPLPEANMDDALLSVSQLLEITKNPALVQGQDAVDILRMAAGMHDLAAKVLATEPIAEFKKFVPHLELIGTAKLPRHLVGKNVPASIIAQNVQARHSDDTARKIAELYIGCLVAHIAHDVELDHPLAAKGDNPDIMFTLKQNAHAEERWASAIKTISSRQGQTIFERIKEGVDQIDHPACRADRGLVVINAKDALDHHALWDPPAPFVNLEAACEALKAQLVLLTANAEERRPQAEWDALFRGKCVRPILFLGQTLVKLPTPAGVSTPTALKLLMQYGANGMVDPVASALARGLNSYMQTILLGIPGSASQQPS